MISTYIGNSLEVQWLGHCDFTAEDPGSILVRELRRSHKPSGTAKKNKNKKNTTYIDPRGCAQFTLP